MNKKGDIPVETLVGIIIALLIIIPTIRFCSNMFSQESTPLQSFSSLIKTLDEVSKGIVNTKDSVEFNFGSDSALLFLNPGSKTVTAYYKHTAKNILFDSITFNRPALCPLDKSCVCSCQEYSGTILEKSCVKSVCKVYDDIIFNGTCRGKDSTGSQGFDDTIILTDETTYAALKDLSPMKCDSGIIFESGASLISQPKIRNIKIEKATECDILVCLNYGDNGRCVSAYSYNQINLECLKKTNPEKYDFEVALNLFKGSKFQDAILSFNQFIVKYPASSLVYDAMYNIAYSYYKQNLLSDSVKILRDIITKYPDKHYVATQLIDKISSELLSSAKTEYASAKYEESFAANELFLTLFPSSSDAEQAHANMLLIIKNHNIQINKYDALYNSFIEKCNKNLYVARCATVKSSFPASMSVSP